MLFRSDLLKQALCRAGAAGALLSGSGATVFGLFARAADAERAASQLRAEFGPNLWTQVTQLRTGSAADNTLCPVV